MALPTKILIGFALVGAAAIGAVFYGTRNSATTQVLDSKNLEIVVRIAPITIDNLVGGSRTDACNKAVTLDGVVAENSSEPPFRSPEKRTYWLRSAAGKQIAVEVAADRVPSVGQNLSVTGNLSCVIVDGVGGSSWQLFELEETNRKP